MIKKLEVCGFKSFKDVKVDMRPLTVLCGTNGSGKSSVMQLLLLLNENAVSGGRIKDAKLNSDLLDLGKQSDVLYRWASTRQCSFKVDSDMGIFLAQADLDSSEDDFITLKSLSSSEQALVDWLRNNIRYLSSDRLSPRTHHKKSSFEVKKRNVGRNGENAVAIFMSNGDELVPEELCHKMQSDAEIDKTLKGQVNAWMREISSGVSLVARANGDQVDLQVDYGGVALEKGFRPENVGFGISYALPVLVMVLTAKRGDCLLIENPGAHLHPQGQAQIGRLLAMAAAYGIQLIIETHSDHVINGIRVACKQICDCKPEWCSEDQSGVRYYNGAVINFFRRVPLEADVYVENYTQIDRIRIESNGEVECYPEGFLDEWPNQMGELV